MAWYTRISVQYEAEVSINNKLDYKFILSELIMMTSSYLSVFGRHNINEFIFCFIHKWIEI